MLNLYLLLIISTLGTLIGDIFGKLWIVKQKPLMWLLAVSIYSIGAISYIQSLKYEGLIITSIIWHILSIIGVFIIGIVFFDEKITLLQSLGIGFGLLALILFSIKG
jgi:drug/metabolite transporter (DMT)-like permease